MMRGILNPYFQIFFIHINRDSMRIIAGKFKNHHLVSPSSKDVRPTSDRIKESIFNILWHHDWFESFAAIRCLDGFCGTGALGFEAYSRGVDSVTFVDVSAESLKVCTENQRKLDPSKKNTHLIRADLSETSGAVALASRGPFDLIFLDPPYQQGLIEKAILSLLSQNLIADGAVLVLETHKVETIDLPVGFSILSEKIYATTKIHFVQRDSAS
jgi:16S rRNA (guanine966-N2)-methyltransferase